MNMPDLAVKALALSIRHLKQFGFERILCLGAAFRPYSCNMEMSLSGNVIQHLEVLRFFFNHLVIHKHILTTNLKLLGPPLIANYGKR